MISHVSGCSPNVLIQTCYSLFVRLFQAQKERFLLYRIRTAGDRAAFTELHDMLAKRVFQYLRHKLPTKEDAEDALTTTFLQLWNYIRKTKVDSVSGLVFTIARSVVASFYRTRDPFTDSFESRTEESSESTDIANDSDMGKSARQTVAKTEIELMKEALGELGEEAELAFSLRYFEGLPIDEVAHIIERSVGATTVLLHRIRKRLQERFENT